jgi:phage-related holin
MSDVSKYTNVKVWIAGAATNLIAIILPIQKFLAIVVVMVVIDFITGIWAALVRKEKIRSRTMQRTTIKITVYLIALLTGHYIDVVFESIIQIVYALAGVIVLTEFKSVLENLSDIVGYDLVEKFASKLPPPFNSLFK